VPVFVMVSIYALYLAAWSFKGAVRKLNSPHEPQFTRFGALLFTVGMQILVFSAVWTILLSEPEGSEAACVWIVTFIPLPIISFASSRSYELYMETSGETTRVRFLIQSNVFTSLLMLALWAGGVLLTGLSPSARDYSLQEQAWVIIYLGSFFLVICLLVEWHVVLRAAYEMIHLLVLFLLGLYFILPLILAGVFSSDFLYQHSPLGAMFAVAAQAGSTEDVALLPVVVNILFCSLLLVPIFSGYKRIVAPRNTC
jgi:hypothetical protein